MPYPGYYAHLRVALERMVEEIGDEEAMVRDTKAGVDPDYTNEAIHHLQKAKSLLYRAETRNYMEDLEE